MEFLWSSFLIEALSKFDHYLILNGILSISLILGILLSNSLFFILGCFGKIGYFPFLLVLACLWYCSSYLFLMIDLINIEQLIIPYSIKLFQQYIGFNRVGNLVFDNSLFHLIVLIFYVSIVNILSLYNRSSFAYFFACFLLIFYFQWILCSYFDSCLLDFLTNTS